jgi:hypothetical protein
MKTIATLIILTGALASCTYYEDDPDGVTSTTRESATTVVDHATGESATTRRTTTHYPD